MQNTNTIQYNLSLIFPPLLFFPFPRDILRVGVTLAGHQKKILNSVQVMRTQMSQIQSVEV